MRPSLLHSVYKVFLRAQMKLLPNGSSEQVIPGLRCIVLTGFMGSGKSTVGPLLARKLGWKFVDLDSEIEHRCGGSVTALFDEQGEAYFRKEESSALRAVLGRSAIVVALGGGAPETAANRQLLQNSKEVAVVFLQAPFSQLQERCERQKPGDREAIRPLFRDTASALERFEARQALYRAIATISVDTSHLAPSGVVDAVLVQLRTSGYRGGKG